MVDSLKLTRFHYSEEVWVVPVLTRMWHAHSHRFQCLMGSGPKCNPRKLGPRWTRVSWLHIPMVPPEKGIEVNLWKHTAEKMFGQKLSWASWKRIHDSIKGIVQLKMSSLSSFTHPHVVPNSKPVWHLFFCGAEYMFLKRCQCFWFFNTMNVSGVQCCVKTPLSFIEWTKTVGTFFKILHSFKST